ncbi:hypothetical protein [Mesorhizobium sp. B2-8-9]
MSSSSASLFGTTVVSLSAAEVSTTRWTYAVSDCRALSASGQ